MHTQNTPPSHTQRTNPPWGELGVCVSKISDIIQDTSLTHQTQLLEKHTALLQEMIDQLIASKIDYYPDYAHGTGTRYKQSIDAFLATHSIFETKVQEILSMLPPMTHPSIQYRMLEDLGIMLQSITYSGRKRPPSDAILRSMMMSEELKKSTPEVKPHQRLRMEYISLKDFTPTQIASVMGIYPELNVLDLESCHLDMLTPDQWNALLGSLPYLKCLYIDEPLLDLSHCGEAYKHLRELWYLGINSDLSKLPCDTFLALCKNIRNLKGLFLNGNDFLTWSTDHLRIFASNFVRLETLDVRFYEFSRLPLTTIEILAPIFSQAKYIDLGRSGEMVDDDRLTCILSHAPHLRHIRIMHQLSLDTKTCPKMQQRIQDLTGRHISIS